MAKGLSQITLDFVAPEEPKPVPREEIADQVLQDRSGPVSEEPAIQKRTEPDFPVPEIQDHVDPIPQEREFQHRIGPAPHEPETEVPAVMQIKHDGLFIDEPESITVLELEVQSSSGRDAGIEISADTLFQPEDQAVKDQPGNVNEAEHTSVEPGNEETFPESFHSGQSPASPSVKKNPSGRGRRSLKDMPSAGDFPEIPDDEILFSKQYYSMGEVALMFHENQSLIRYWETEFDILKPKKNGKGDRFFRPADVKNLFMIYDLLRRRKFTIEGAKEYLRGNRQAEERFEMIRSLGRIRNFLLELRAGL
ncbi:MAG: MerR family transcriptional regulator [Chitinophagaceae bacterium]